MENLVFDENLVSSKPQLKEFLEIISKNLDEFNNRNGFNVKLKYEPTSKNKFQLVGQYDFKKHDIASYSSQILYYLNHPKEQDEFCEIFISSVSKKKNSIIGNIGWNESEKIEFTSKKTIKKNADEFVRNYKNYHPIGFLSPEQELEIKQKLNGYCDELSMIVENYLNH